MQTLVFGCDTGQEKPGMVARIHAIVDMSNVCRDESIGPSGPANLTRYDLVRTACAQLTGDEESVLGVADESLISRLSAEDRRRMKTMIRDGAVLTAPKADLPILRLSDEHGAIVISRDNFKDHRKEFPWIARIGGRFWDWVPSADEQVVLQERHMPRYTDYELSRAADRDDLKGQFHLDDERLEEVLTHRWACTNAACLSHRFPVEKRPLPKWDGTAYRCSGCGSAVEKGEPRPRAIELKFGNARGDEIRPVLEQGASLTVGRESPDVDIAKLAGAEAKVLSGEHARFDFDGNNWFVTDLGSRNGTWVAEWDHRRDEREDWQQLQPHRRTPLGERCRVSLANVIRVDRSGKLSVRS